MASDEQQYSENGFELVVYNGRQADQYTRCPQCGAALFHVASTFEDQGERQSRTVHYHYCKRCEVIRQKTIRERLADIMSDEEIVRKAPQALQIELLAVSRYLEGRGISLLTINERWWKPRRYPLVSGDLMAPEAPRVRPLYHHEKPETRIVDEESLRVTPMPRYQPVTEPDYNPFTSRRLREDEEEREEAEAISEDEAASEAETAPENFVQEKTPEPSSDETGDTSNSIVK